VAASLVAVLAATVGLLVGSFANVAIHRWPLGRSVNDPPRSHCPSCDAEIAPRDNIPVVSWLVLRGRCRQCNAPISARYPLVEALVGVLFGLVAAVHSDTWALPAFLALTWVLVVGSFIDAEHRILPNRMTLRAPLILLPLLFAAAGIEDAWPDLLRGLVFALGIPAAMLAVSELFRLIRGQSGIGMGDIKLAISLGLVLGWLGGAEVVAFLYASLIAAVVVALGLVLTGRAKLASRIPFGPYLALGTLAVLLSGEAAGDLVDGLFGLR